LHGETVQPSDLLPHFERVEAARTLNGEVSLTYFEFTTLAILSLMASSPIDVAILEVGLGGRLDAVNVIEPTCSVITSVDLDHMDFLGHDRETIGREKAGIMRTGRPVIVSDPVPPQSVIDHATEISADLWLFGRDFNFTGDKQQWGWAGRGRRYSGLAYPALRGANQLVNASGVLAALEALRSEMPVTAQAIRNGLAMVELPGRFQIVPGQPALVFDVAHNAHAVAALTENLDAMGFYPTTHVGLGPWPTKMWPPCWREWAPWWIAGTFVICPPSVRLKPRSFKPLGKRATVAKRCKPVPMPTHKPHSTPQWLRQTPLIELWSSDRSSRSGVFWRMAYPV